MDEFIRAAEMERRLTVAFHSKACVPRMVFDLHRTRNLDREAIAALLGISIREVELALVAAFYHLHTLASQAEKTDNADPVSDAQYRLI